MVANTTPHSIDQRRDTGATPPPAKPRGPTMPEKVAALIEELERDKAAVLIAGRRASQSVTGRAISLAVVKRAIRDELLTGVAGTKLLDDPRVMVQEYEVTRA